MNDLGSTWSKVNDAFLEAHLDRLRLLARRQVHHLRAARWRTDPLDTQDAEARVDRALAGGSGDPAQRPPGRTGEGDLEAALAEADDQLAAFERELDTLGGPTALTVLGQAVGLSQVERDAVLVALGPELDHSFRALYAYLHDDPSLRYATAGLVADLTGRSLPEVWDLLRQDAPSRRFRVFAASDGEAGAAAPLRLDARVVAFLRGSNQPDDRLRDVVELLPELPLAPTHRAAVQRLSRWLSDPGRVATQRVVHLLGAPGQGREAVAAALAPSLGLLPLRVHLQHLAGPAEAERRRLLDRETVLLPAALYVDWPGEDGPAGGMATAVRTLDDLGGLLLIGSRTPVRGGQPAVAVGVPPLAPDERLDLWEVALGRSELSTEDLADLVEQFALGPEGIARAAGEAKALAELHAADGPRGPSRRQVWAACRMAAGGELGDLASSVRPTATWDDLILPERQRATLRVLASQVACRPRVYETWGFGRTLSRGRGITALFAGPSGTGKTMAAEVIAGHLDLDLQRIDLSSVVSKYIGETEKNLRRVFDAAEAGGAVLFFDEADALFGKRTEVSDSHDRYANVEISYLLQRMEDYAGLAILATNRKGDLDAAFLRRIRFVVTFPFPDAVLRRCIWQRMWPAETPLEDLDWDALAGLEIAGGNIRTIALNAAFLAAEAGEPVAMRHLMRAARLEYDKLDRRPTYGEFGDRYQEVQ